jgi:hypothetical protein
MVAVIAVVVSIASVSFGSIGSGGQIATCANAPKRIWYVLKSTTGSCPTGTTKVTLYTQSGANAAFLTQSTADGLYLGKTAQAADSAKLGGISPSAFEQGGTGDGNLTFDTGDGIHFVYFYTISGASTCQWQIQNATGGSMNLWYQVNSATPTFTAVANTNSLSSSLASADGHLIFHATWGASGTLTLDTWQHWTGSSCVGSDTYTYTR